MNKILLVEDEANLRHIIASYLRKENFIVIEAGDGEQALERFASDEFNLIILDVMLPKRNGYDVCKVIRTQSQVPILILTARDTEQDELMGFSCGADEYITKPFSPDILIARTKSLLKRCNLLLENELCIEALSINYRQRTAQYNGERLVLTPKEFDLLYYLVNNRNIALSREQILNQVWGYDYFGDTRTVDTHIKCLRAKLGDFGEHIITVRKYGYKLEC
ncbi:MAG: response regulator transcription factor [Lachnospiraceae bacterium]|nr:response regulator transcription factor [Lachnospiraceae bacterium]